MRNNNLEPLNPLTGPASAVLQSTEPVVHQVDKLISDIDTLKLGSNNTPGYLFLPRLGYSAGIASKPGTLAQDIANLSLGSVVEAASAMKGSSRSLMALKRALEHTPDPWRDSPQLIREKLTTIKARLQDVVDDAKKYGHKIQPEGGGASRGNGDVSVNELNKLIDAHPAGAVQ